MITTWEEQKNIVSDFMKEYQYTRYNLGEPPTIKEIFQVVELDKPIKIYTNQSLDLNFSKDNENYYEMLFGQGIKFPKEKEGIAWLSDEHSIFFFERPFQNKVVNTLKNLLPSANIVYNHNDIEINGIKNGATLRTGYQNQKGHRFITPDSETILEKSEPLSGMIYILRWDDLEGLNNVFKDVKHHQDRLENKSPIGTLSQFLTPLGITKQDFINLLEN